MEAYKPTLMAPITYYEHEIDYLPTPSTTSAMQL